MRMYLFECGCIVKNNGQASLCRHHVTQIIVGGSGRWQREESNA